MTEGIRLASLLRPVRARNAFEETVERLLTAIRLGVVGPGERFPAEREFAIRSARGKGVQRLQHAPGGNAENCAESVVGAALPRGPVEVSIDSFH